MRYLLVASIVFLSLQGTSPNPIETAARSSDHPYARESNMTLHRLINMASVESLVLLSPHYEKEKTYDIVLLVISAEYEKEEREEIRRQWASKKESMMQKMGKSVVIFLVGQSSALDEEAAQYGDLLLVDIEESYRNLVYKIEVGYRWITENVQSKFVAKIDSDTVVHIDRLVGILRRYDAEQPKADWLACHTMSNAWVFRDEDSQWYISYNDYPHSRYPRFCAGPGYVMKSTTLAKIAKSMGSHRVLEVEDVFFTGVIAQQLGIRHIDEEIATGQYQHYSECRYGQPLLSILNTHYQFGWSKSRKDLPAAWRRLKQVNCYWNNGW